ncbi:hypothetical protein [Clostridium baratii]|uniref:hypothetical protein n=1 Tax=Clostridium baratii TaxID=1561 RepID=UPI0030D1B48C
MKYKKIFYIIGGILLIVIAIVSYSLLNNGSKDIAEKNRSTLEKIDLNRCIKETRKELTDKNNFGYVKNINIKVDEDKKEIILKAVVDDSTSEKTALEFADIFIRRFNLLAKTQDNNIKSGRENYLGGLYDEYNIVIGVSRVSDMKRADQWYVSDYIAKGSHKEPVLQRKYRY